jgi:hypothetical protein
MPISIIAIHAFIRIFFTKVDSFEMQQASHHPKKKHDRRFERVDGLE